MKMVKFNKRLLKKDWADILRHFGLVNETKREAYPERLYMSKDDINTVRKNCRNKLKKQFKYGITKKRLDITEAMEFLNLGANSSIGIALKSGYALVANEEENE